jgi:tetratricopeptide (TPR) repeat protein
MCRRFLLSLSLLLLLAARLNAQAPICDDEAAIDSAINALSRKYDYTSQGWQDACDSLLWLCPDLDQVWQMKAMPAIKTGDWYNCFSNLIHAVQIAPERWLPYQAFLKCLFVKDYAGALDDFRRCESMRPGGSTQDHSYNFYMGISCLGMRNLMPATTYLKKDVENQEKFRGKENVHYVSLFYWGLCQMMNGGYEEAKDALQRSLKVYPQYPEALFYYGLCLKREGREREAKTYFRKAGESIKAGYNSNEDQEFYVNYPFAISMTEVDAQLTGQ